jgi:hypothetical protein
LHVPQFRRRDSVSRFLHDDSHEAKFLFRKVEVEIYESPEWQAWEFCKSIFMPRIAVENAVDEGCSVRDISEIINLNPAFVESRLRNLRMLGRVRAF